MNRASLFSADVPTDSWAVSIAANGRIVLAVAVGLLAIGLWLALPRGGARGRIFGAVLTLSALGLFMSRMPMVGDWVASSVFYILAAVTVISAVATITIRNPVYSAIWFAMSLLGTAGLFFFQGAQFLGVATIVVYAGAILVTFLFVLMLAQPEGHAYYDRLSWEAFLSAATGAALVGVLSLAVSSVFAPPGGAAKIEARHSAAELQKDVLSENHVAHLGGELFSRQLIAVEVAGTLLLVALVAAVAIVAETKATNSARARGGSHG